MEENYLNKLLINVNGHNTQQISDLKVYIAQNYQELLDPKQIKKVYKALLAEKNIEMVDKVINLLIRNFIYFRYDAEGSFVKYLTNAAPENVLYLFRHNEFLGEDLIRSYFLSYKMPPREVSIDAKKLMAKFSPQSKVIMLGDLLRESFEIVYNTFLMTGVPTKSVTAAMRAAIFGGMYVLGDKVIENAVQTLIMYRDFLPHLMYADVYEDILALGLEHSYEKVAVRVIDKAIRNNDFIWPKDPEEADVLLNYFAYLCTCEDKRMENRNIIKNSKTIPDEKKLVVSKINPLWKLDESGIINKR